MIEPKMAPPAPMTYASSTTTQNANPIPIGGVHQQIIGIQVVTAGSLSPISATQFDLNTTGTTSTSDISNAKIFYTGTSNIFAKVNQFGSTVVSPSGSYSVVGTQTLVSARTISGCRTIFPVARPWAIPRTQSAPPLLLPPRLRLQR